MVGGLNETKPSKKAFQLKESPPPSMRNKVGRMLWGFVWLLFFRSTPRPFHAWRCILLRIFGAKIGKPAYVYPSARIWAPWNLQLGNHSTIGEYVNCYCVDKITIDDFSTISQNCFLCTASHDYLDPAILNGPCMQLVTAPIVIGKRAWITADVFVAPGVRIHDGVVVLARSCVLQDIPEWTVVAGNPAIERGPRVLREIKLGGLK